MIVRLMGEGQFDVPANEIDALNALDTQLEAAVTGRDKAGFDATYAALLAKVRACGTPVPVDVLVPSDIVLPPVDATIDDVQALLAGDGLIPG